MRATAFSNARFSNFKFMQEIVESIGEQLKNGSIIFYPNSKEATCCLENDFDRFEEILYSSYLDFTVRKRKITLSFLTAIPEKSLKQLSVFHPEVNELTSNPIIFFNKIEKYHSLSARGELIAESFEYFYFEMKKSFLENFIDDSCFRTNYLNLFTSPATETLHRELFRYKRSIWKEWDEFRLNFTDSSQIPQYETTDFSMKKFDHLLVNLDKNARLDLLEKAFDNKNIISIHLSFYCTFNQYDKLIGIIHEKTFQSLIINTIYGKNENALKFIDDLVRLLFGRDFCIWEYTIFH